MINYANYVGGSAFFLHLEWGRGVSPKLVGRNKNAPAPLPPLIYDQSLSEQLLNAL